MADVAVAVPIAVADPVPTYRRGLTGALRDIGLPAEAVDAPEAWAATSGDGVLLLTVELPEDAGAIARLKTVNPELRVVALVRTPTVAGFKEALREGASAVVAWEDTPEQVIEVMLCVLHDHCLLPVDVVRALVAGNGVALDVPEVTAAEVRWLQRLADGATVSELARQSSYSEREMFRLLQRLYRRMEVPGRVAAIVKAARTGLLNDHLEAEPASLGGGVVPGAAPHSCPLATGHELGRHLS
jgi:two-component system competent response regulator ComA